MKIRKNLKQLIGRGVALGALLLLALTASAQSWEEVRENDDYIYGEGWGSTVTEADKQALANLIGKIATNVSGESHSSLKTQNSNGQLNEESQFSQTVSTYSQATLTNTQQKVLKNEPDAYVVRWIKKSEIEKIFESRKRKALDLIETAVRAEKKGKVDDVLRNYYWALTLLKSLQYPNEVTYTDEDGKEHVCTNWCKEKIDDTFYELKTIYDSREGNDIRLAITYKGKPVSQMNEKERIMRSIEDFLARRYELRFNTVKQTTEFRPNDLRFKQWRPLTDRELKSIVVEEMKEGGESWMNDIRTYVESAHIKDYNPIHEFLAGCGDWDGKRNYIEDFARRLPTDYARWPQYFHRWFLAMVAQALDLNRDYGNSMVPLLIGEQGFMKTQFCNHILPPSMREYYMKDIKMDNAEQVERVLGRMWLVNIDEYDSKTQREQAKIKRLLTEKDVQVRKMRSEQYTMTPRLCSFIATTNDTTPLPSGDGTRRYLCVEVTGCVDMSGQIPYKQLFAQAVTELRNPDCVYWFTDEDEREIQQHNRQYQQESAPEQVLMQLFEPSKQHKKECFWTTTAIQNELGNHLKTADVPNLRQLGIAIKKLHWQHIKNNGTRGYYLKLKKGDL